MQQGFFSIQQTCHQCNGAGKILTSPCRACNGLGRVKKKKKLIVKVPAGIETGQRIRLANEGESGLNQGPPGDLYVQIDVREHHLFKRDDRNNLLCGVPISFTMAALGCLLYTSPSPRDS